MSSDIIFHEPQPLPPNESLAVHIEEFEGRTLVAQKQYEQSVDALREKDKLDLDVRNYGDAERELARVEVEGLFIEAFRALGFHERLSVKILKEYAKNVQISKDLGNK